MALRESHLGHVAVPRLAAPPSLARLALVCALFGGVGIVLIWRLYTFQVLEVSRYQALGDEERRLETPIIPRRGALLDTNGSPLAVSVMYESVYALGSQVEDPDRAAALLSPVLEKPAAEIRARLDPNSQRPVVLRSRVPSSVSEQVRNLKIRGVYLDKEPIREYPEGSIAAQVLGFVGRDFTGLAGLELSYDKVLAGTPGLIDAERDTTGQPILLGDRVLKPARQGSDLVLTIDRFVQRTAERLLDAAVKKNRARGGLIVVMDPRSGDLLAVANNPTYNLTAREIYQPDRASLYNARVATEQYEPGSTMKPITMASAIDEGLVNPNTTVNDTGTANIQGTVIHNWNGAADGVITMTQVLIRSSNVGTQWVAGLLGPDRFYRHLLQFGFGTPTGIRLPGEIGGTVRTNTTPGWTRIDLATNSYGQGIAVTPLQMLAAIAALGNDGVLVQPRLVREIRGPDGVQELQPRDVRQVVSAQTARTVVRMMVAVAEQEALKPHRIPGYTIALKTGTADTPTDLGYDLNDTFASVVALVPAQNPRFAILIRVDGPEALYGGIVAVPVLTQLAEEMLAYYRIPPDNLSAQRPGAP